MRLALAQLRLGGTPAENLEASLAAVARAARARADLALFPEAQLTPFFAQYRRAELRRSPLRLHPDRIAVREDGPEIAALRRSARDHRLWIAPNAYLDRDDGLRADATLLVAPTGSVVGRAEMVHVANLPGFWEEDWYAPARDGFRVFDTPFGRLGVVICFDRHFPESFREVALAGADLALVPAANRFDEPFELFEAELRAAAFQNGLFVAMCNRTGADGDTFFGGRSIVVGPGGEVLLRAWLATLPKPCALLAANDTVGRSVLAAAKALGLRVPDDLAVCAVDNDTETCLHASPTLTSIEPDFYAGGFLAGELLVRLAAKDPDVPRVSTFGALRVRRRESTSPAVVRDSLARKALSCIAARAASGLAAADVVRLFDCSRRSAEMRFRRATGMSIQEAILAERVETAKALMRRPGLKLEAIAALSGWKTYSVFRRRFAAACGLPPSQWRTATRKGGIPGSSRPSRPSTTSPFF